MATTFRRTCLRGAVGDERPGRRRSSPTAPRKHVRRNVVAIPGGDARLAEDSQARRHQTCRNVSAERYTKQTGAGRPNHHTKSLSELQFPMEPDRLSGAVGSRSRLRGLARPYSNAESRRLRRGESGDRRIGEAGDISIGDLHENCA